ncbi:hypothetical protein BT96DRAFT_965636 [Gymnopus androsaceus JB14]|uniref:Elongation factor methyltransferase 7 n=1 Tax=Gymnopus androsaceus JB14 TaxID=1447944 RepID=A0A6A4HR22_9AGAR|nr:hypothetical protein BT96DRAFT_965636 [Gymnopus androsaceus JB14]
MEEASEQRDKEAPRPPSPEATFSTYQGARKEFKIRLVGSHPLWGHHLWNSALSVASYLEEHLDIVQEKNVLELGAGGALPSLVALESGARKVVITDYPDPDLVQNIEYNAREIADESRKTRLLFRCGYIWGHSVKPLLTSLNTSPPDENTAFDLIILSDLIFNHSQHDALLKTCHLALKSSTLNGKTLFFTKAKEQGWDCVEVVTQKFKPMFPDDPGEEQVRATVHGWILTRENVK